MYNIKTDTHTHTLASGHAYSTVEENVRAASEQGLEAMGNTDHFSSLFVTSTDFRNYASFGNFKALPKEWYGVRLFNGAEVDIVDLEGNLFGRELNMPYGPDMTYLDWITGGSDYLIASVHDKRFTLGATLAQTTEMYCKALENKKVLFLGHIGRAGVPFELDEVLLAAKSLGKMIEINEASLEYPEEIRNRCRQVAVRCAELGVSISVGSDAHSSYYIGRFDKTRQMLEEIRFPEELIGTRSRKTLEEMIGRL